MKLPNYIEQALENLKGSGFQAHVVGGCVRDMIMGKTPADYDITTNALPMQIEDCFKDYRVIESGIKHGTVTVVIGGENVEITTYRVDGEYIDNRRPQNVNFTSSINDDLARRDFTMNAICYNPHEGTIDPFGGEEDIKKGIIRCVGNPDKRFNEDGLRILRALRFAAKTGFEIEGETARSIKKNKDLIKNLSAERIFAELKKLLCGDFAHEIIDGYKDVFAVFIPEIVPMIGFKQNTKYHYLDVFAHTMEALKNCEKSEVLRLAIFLHDIGKPMSFTQDEKGISHFKGHGKIGAEMAEKILRRLKADNMTTEKVCKLIRLHDIKILTDTEIKIFISENGFEITKLLLKVKKADASAKAKEYRNLPELDHAEKLVNRLETSGEPLFLSDLEVTGDDLTDLGIRGKKVGEILKNLLMSVILGETPNKRNELIKKAEEYLADEEK